RGQHRRQRGERRRPTLGEREAVLGYRGRDGVERRLRLEFAPAPHSLEPHEALFAVQLAPQATLRITVTLRCERDGRIPGQAADFAEANDAARARLRTLREAQCDVSSSNTAFAAWIARSQADLDMLTTALPTGPYPYAGIPWFNTAFGRDGIITALEALWAMPDMARGVLVFLAETQATENDPARDAEPGKILHETRKSEMAALGEVPFGRYYGSIDATPLFVVLAAAYHARSGDTAFIRRLWPNIAAALAWMRDHGDLDGDGFIEYDRRAEQGLSNQGWKDSGDAIFHADGRLARPPVALVEVQAYAYAAWQGAAALAAALGQAEDAHGYAARAEALRERFEATFWCEEIGSYALALDGDKAPCRVRSSNAGHALFAGIVTPARAARVAATLMQPEQFSGWGIRTIAMGERRYNPMSYHNGSVWPHDNGLIAMGFARYGLRAPLLKVMDGMFAASAAVELHRLPELFCGFPRREREGPTLYPVACSPQAWSSACAFALLGATLGISFHPGARQIRLTRPLLPDGVDELRIERLRMDGVSADLLFRRDAGGVALSVLRKVGDAEIVVIA
ncbi:MAG TPA: amylo-alpha-1,6-glucosidase, partial [Stellaceae bacterium]|nr:amylo-alpha-1,6-glucosidase [Stellaceae bacterium]